MNTTAKDVLALMKRSSQVSLGALAAIGLMGIAQVSAQTVTPNPLADFQNSDVSDPFSGRGGNQSSGVMDLIHRAMQNGSQNSEDFRAAQDENFDEATAAFRASQTKLFRNQNQAAPVFTTPVTTPELRTITESQTKQ